MIQFSSKTSTIYSNQSKLKERSFVMDSLDQLEGEPNRKKYVPVPINLIPYYELLSKEDSTFDICAYWLVFQSYCEFQSVDSFLKICEDYLRFKTIDLGDFQDRIADFDSAIEDHINDFEFKIDRTQPLEMNFNPAAVYLLKILQNLRNDMEALTDYDPLSEEDFRSSLQKYYEQAKYYSENSEQPKNNFDGSDQENE